MHDKIGALKIMLVDDDVWMRRLVRQMLTQFHIRDIKEYADGEFEGKDRRSR